MNGLELDVKQAGFDQPRQLRSGFVNEALEGVETIVDIDIIRDFSVVVDRLTRLRLGHEPKEIGEGRLRALDLR